MHKDVEDDCKITHDDDQYWFVMTHMEPSLIDRQLQRENAERLRNGQATILYVIPYLYMVKANVEKGLEDKSQGSSESLCSPKDVNDNNSLRASLQNFVFVKATKDEIVDLTNRDWNRLGRLHLYHYRTKSGSPIKTTQEEMQPLLNFFIEQHQRFSFTPYSEDISANETVYIKRGIFKDYKASVIEIHHLSEGISLTLGIPLFNSEVMMKLYDYSVSDVEVQGQMEHIFEPQFVNVLESDLFDILRRRVLHRNTDETFRNDMGKLNTYNILHYLKFDDTATHNHFQALMLLCATLRNDRQMKEKLIPTIRKMVRDAEQPATDEEAFYMATLFFATKSVDYRRTLREYCQTMAVTSESLSAIMPLVKKMRLRPQKSNDTHL